MNIESKLGMLFDYQKFEGNALLSEVINKDKECIRELSDNELDMVSAAGVTEYRNNKDSLKQE